MMPKQPIIHQTEAIMNKAYMVQIITEKQSLRRLVIAQNQSKAFSLASRFLDSGEQVKAVVIKPYHIGV